MAEQDPQKAETEITEEHESGSEQAASPEAGTASEELLQDEMTEASPESELDALQAELAAAKDAALRAHADAQNAQRRAEQDVERARKYALERFTGELLPVVDNLERALEATGADSESAKPIAEGVELTLKGLIDALTKQGVEQVNPEGEPFDPNLHQAMSMVENKDVEPNTVIAVMQKGYTLNGRLIRPAMVMVSK